MNKLVLVLFAVFLLCGVAFAQDTTFSETVENGSLENTWYAEWNGNNLEVEFMAGNPSGDSWVGKLGNDLSGGGVGSAFSGDPSWTDFRFEAWVYIPVEAATAGTYYGIEFRVDSVGNGTGYQFLARFRENLPDKKLRFRARSGAIPTVIKDWVAAEIPGGIPDTSGWHHMAVEANGNQFRFFFNGNELPGGPYVDNTFSSGYIGAYVWDFAVSPIYLFIDDIFVINTSTGIEDSQQGVLSGYELHQNFPNPFNPSTIISFELPVSEFVELNIFNNLGQRVSSLASREFAAGTHRIQWDGRDDFGMEAPAGIYYYSIQAGDFKAANKMLLVK